MQISQRNVTVVLRSVMLRRVRPGRIVAVLVMLVGIAGCTDPDGDASGPVAEPPAGSAVPSAVLDDPPGAIACGQVVAAVRDASLMMPGVIDGVAAASRTADAPVADAAQRLAAAHAAVVGAAGTEDEPDKVAALSAAAAEMVDVCGDSGLETVG